MNGFCGSNKRDEGHGLIQRNEAECTDAEKLFDLLSQSYSEAYESNWAQIHGVQRLISKLPAGSRILDVGSGTGQPTASLLAGAGMIVTGIDLSPAMVDAARDNVPGATFHNCDMRAYEPPNGEQFDAVVAIFSIINVPTQDIKEMAFKMAHWLRVGGYLLLGTIDFTDVAKANGYPADPYHEWLNHDFMGQVIKDNIFGVGQWISLLRSVDIALVDAQGSVFAAQEHGIDIEPECFIIGRKGERDSLLGPYPSKSKLPSQPLHRLWAAEQQLVRHDNRLKSLMHDNSNTLWVSSSNVSRSLSSEICMCQIGVNGSKPATCTSAPNGLGKLMSQKAHFPGKDRVLLVAPAPFNDALSIVNEVAEFFNIPIYRIGEHLREFQDDLQRIGFMGVQIHLLGEEFLDFSENADGVQGAVRLLGPLLLNEAVSMDVVNVALRARVVRYFESQKHLGGKTGRMGFQRVVMEARRVSNAGDCKLSGALALGV